MFPRRRMFVSESDSVPHFLCQCTVCLQPAIRGSHHVRGYSGDWGLYGLPCPCILVQAWPSGHIITKSFTRCFFSAAPSPYCRRLLIPHKATCLSCDVCHHSQLSQRDSCSSSPLWEPRLSLQKLILRGDSANSVRRARACRHPGVCTAALAHKLPNPTFSRHSGHAPRCQAVSLALCFL